MNPGDLADRSPPHNDDAERSVLGSMLRDNGVISDVVNIVREDSFYQPAHRKIFKAIKDLWEKSHPVDLVTLGEQLKELKQVEEVNGYEYLLRLWDETPSAANSEFYAKIVKEKAIIRSLIHAGTDILRDSYNQAAPAEDLLGEAERRIMEIASVGVTGQTYTLEQAINEAMDRIDTRSQRDQWAVSGVPTGYVDLDDKTGGLQESELIIVAARPSVGKCLTADAEIVLADGTVTTIEAIYRRRRARLLTLGNDWRLAWAEPSAFVDDGLKPVYRVTTRLGRQIETTLSHPFLTTSGWQPLAELTVGDLIAVPRRMPVSGREELRECEIKLLAYLIGDGGLTDNSPEFTNANARIRADFTQAVEEWKASSFAPQAERRRTHFAVPKGSAFVRWDESASPTVPPRGAVGLEDSSHPTKNHRQPIIPPQVFRLVRPQLALFLSRLVAVHGAFTDGPAVRLTFSATWAGLARQVRHLLLRFGILANLREGANHSWHVEIREPSSLQTFLTEIGLFGDEAAEARLGAAVDQAPKDAMPGCGDIAWDTIVTIEPIGIRQVYDLTIPGTHNFVANDVCVHNTAFTLNLTRNIAVNEGLPVFFVSLEQAKIEIAERILCAHSRVDSFKLRKGHLSSDEMQKLVQAAGELRDAKIFIDDTPGQTMLRILANARRLKLRHDIRCVVIDYLQLIEPESKKDSRQEQVAQISRKLKFMAKELKIPVIACAQLNRGVENRQDNVPRLSDLRESGSIEQDADTVMLLHRPDYYNRGENGQPPPDEGLVEVHIAKQRNGPVGEVRMTYIKQYMRYENFAIETPFVGGA